jgi:hypothetical protein
MDKKLISEQLHALARSNSNRSKTALLRDIFDEIEMALAAGVRRTAILELLAKQNIHMSIATFDVSIRRIRKERNQQKIDTNQTVIKNNKLENSSKEEQITSNDHTNKQISENTLDQKTNNNEQIPLTKKQQREKMIDRFMKPETQNPLLGSLKENKE